MLYTFFGQTALPAFSLAQLSSDDIIKVIIFSGGILVALVAIIFGTISSISKRRQTEESRRELAAYVAEGSMTPEDAERILKAGKPKWEC
ncbi:MAG: hypothetical protein KF866_10445 [Phycisphaeraceae bacterium]|nr:hypothetical protein [Phycisphaeraceae bacterium]MCW5754921.1 hypothetical protein [Phycisphaeraceae bacterium]